MLNRAGSSGSIVFLGLVLSSLMYGCTGGGGGSGNPPSAFFSRVFSGTASSGGTQLTVTTIGAATLPNGQAGENPPQVTLLALTQTQVLLQVQTGSVVDELLFQVQGEQGYQDVNVRGQGTGASPDFYAINLGLSPSASGTAIVNVASVRNGITSQPNFVTIPLGGNLSRTGAPSGSPPLLPLNFIANSPVVDNSGILYTIAEGSGSSDLVAINPANGYSTTDIVARGAFSSGNNFQHHLALDSSTGLIWTATPSAVTAVNPANGQTIKMAPLNVIGTAGVFTGNLVIDPGTRRVYVLTTTGNSSNYAVIDADSSTLISSATLPGPNNTGDIALDAIQHRVYVMTGDGVYTIDEATSQATLHSNFGNVLSSFAVVNPTTHELFIAKTGEGTLLIWNPVADPNAASLRTVVLSGHPYGVDVDPASDRVFTATGGMGGTAPNFLDVIDGTAGNIVQSIPIGNATQPRFVIYDAVAHTALVGDQSGNGQFDLSILDLGLFSRFSSSRH